MTNLKTTSALVVCLVCSASRSTAQSQGAGEWTGIGPPGGEIFSLSIDPHNPGTLFAATASGHAFKSLNGGANWILSGVPNSVLIFDPQSPGTIYTYGSFFPGILKSTDNGTSWSPANSGLPDANYTGPVLALAIDSQHPLTLYAGTYGGVFKSSDGGTSWSATNSGLPTYINGRYAAAYAVLIDPKNPDTIFVVNPANGLGQMVSRSTNGGADWSRASSGLPESNIKLAIDPQNTSTLYASTRYGIFKSTDSGTSWTAANSGLPSFPNGPFYAIVADSLAVDPLQPGTVYATVGSSSDNRVLKTTNGGASWSDASAGLPRGTYFGFLTIDPQNPATLYTGDANTFGEAGDGITYRGVFKSTDGGMSWTAANSGLNATWIMDLAIDPQNPSRLYVATHGGLLKTTDRGATWSAADSGLTGAGSTGMAIDPQDASTVFVGAANTSGGFAYGVFKSTDGGERWSPSLILSLIPSDQLSAITTLAVDPRNSDIVYATSEYQSDEPCGDGRLHKSLDGGIIWSASLFKDMGISASCILALVIDPQQPANLYAAFSYGGVFKSTDAGASWSPANSGLTDAQGSSSARTLAIDPRNSAILYAVSSPGSSWSVFKSNDAGASWNLAGSGLPLLSKAYKYFLPRLVVDPTKPDRVYLGAVYSGSALVFKSDDGAASWTDSGLAVSDNCCGIFGGLAVSSQVPGTVFAGTHGEGVFAMGNEVTK